MADDPFDRLVAQLDTAMVVVTATAAGEVDGCLVGFHSQCSIRPRRYALWLSTVNRTYRIARSSAVLGVHALAVDQHDVAAHFGGETGDDVDKLAGVAWSPGPDGVPLLDDVADRFVGRVVQRVEVGGDHELFVVEPADARVAPSLTPLRLSGATDIAPGHPA
jgi:flavin reductase (DIM6/NTAB) family NADH-FMN oxidoreductase RutF